MLYEYKKFKPIWYVSFIFDCNRSPERALVRGIVITICGSKNNNKKSVYTTGKMWYNTYRESEGDKGGNLWNLQSPFLRFEMKPN